jgi:hypothetical protein
MLGVADGHETIAEAAPRLALLGLAGDESPLAASASRFVCLRKMSEDVSRLESVHGDGERLQEEVARLLQATREDLAGRADAVGSLSDDELALVMKAMVHEQFLSAAPAMLTWLVEILESKQQSPSTRARAVKALGDIVAADRRLLDAPSLLVAVEHALQDDSISVREAALVLVGRHMAQDPDLAVRLIHIVIRASEDSGSSVRKSAIRILRDCCLIIPEERYDKVIESYKAILNRSADSEESVKSLVIKIFKSMWFDAVAEGDEKDNNWTQRSPMDRAKSLARMASAVAGPIPSGGCRGLIDRSHPLVVLLREIGDDEVVDQQGTAASLLNLFVYGGGGGGGDGGG